jgi:hypothetical protein
MHTLHQYEYDEEALAEYRRHPQEQTDELIDVLYDVPQIVLCGGRCAAQVSGHRVAVSFWPYDDLDAVRSPPPLRGEQLLSLSSHVLS